MTKNILFADNNVDFLDTRAEFLVKAGYNVIKATGRADAEKRLKEDNIHLAILDIRMENDDDDRDESGLILAKQKEYRSIPKIILTGYPIVKGVKGALKQQPDGFIPALDFVIKGDGVEALLNAIEEAFSYHVKINWNLVIDWKTTNQFSIIPLIEAGVEGAPLLQRAEELKDLFCRLFHDKERIRIDRLLWQQNGRIALTIFAFEDHVKPESFLVTCGRNPVANLEASRFDEFAPKAPSDTGTILSLKAETIHFGANAYLLTGNDLEDIQTLGDLYRSGPEKTFNTAVSKLFQETLLDWHQGKPVHANGMSLRALYLEHLGLEAKALLPSSLEDRMGAIEQQALLLGLHIEETENELNFRYGERNYTFPNPIRSLAEDFQDSDLVVSVPGVLSGENIVVDGTGRTWLTDFSSAGQAPLLWNYISLESAIRYDWSSTNDIIRLQEMEQCLANTDFSKLDMRDLEPIIRKPVRAIQLIRKHALRSVGKETNIYHQGILYHAIKRFYEFDPHAPLTSGEAVRIIHILISIATLSGLLERGTEKIKKTEQEDYPELQIDQNKRTVILGERVIRIPPSPFKLLFYLYQHTDRVCSTEELRKNVIGENYNATYIHTIINRIRELIEKDPENARYIVSEHSIGYQLDLHPK